MGSIVHRSVPTNLKSLPNCSHAHALFQDRFKDVQVGSRWSSALYILSPNFHRMSKKEIKYQRDSIKLARTMNYWNSTYILFYGYIYKKLFPNTRKLSV